MKGNIGLAHGAALLALMVAIAPVQAATDLQPGLWKITTTIERNGVVKPGLSQTRCMTADQLKAVGHAAAAPSTTACKRTDFRTTKSGETSRVVCGNYTFASEMSAVTRSSQRYNGKLKMTIDFKDKPASVSTTTFAGERLGECKK